MKRIDWNRNICMKQYLIPKEIIIFTYNINIHLTFIKNISQARFNLCEDYCENASIKVPNNHKMTAWLMASCFLLYNVCSLTSASTQKKKKNLNNTTTTTQRLNQQQACWRGRITSSKEVFLLIVWGRPEVSGSSRCQHNCHPEPTIRLETDVTVCRGQEWSTFVGRRHWIKPLCSLKSTTVVVNEILVAVLPDTVFASYLFVFFEFPKASVCLNFNKNRFPCLVESVTWNYAKSITLRHLHFLLQNLHRWRPNSHRKYWRWESIWAGDDCARPMRRLWHKSTVCVPVRFENLGKFPDKRWPNWRFQAQLPAQQR